jgi:hypothetical protein
MFKIKKYAFLVVLITNIFTFSCSKKTTIIQQEIEQKRIQETAFVYTDLAYVKENIYSLSPGKKHKIQAGLNTIIFNGPVYIKIPKEPLININDESAAAVALTSCLSALPVCPISLIFINMAIGKTDKIEADCNGSIVFNAYRNRLYTVRIFYSEEGLPELRLYYKRNTVAKELLECVIPNKLDK